MKDGEIRWKWPSNSWTYLDITGEKMDINRKTWKKYASAEQVWWVEPAENMESKKEKTCFITQQGSGQWPGKSGCIEHKQGYGCYLRNWGYQPRKIEASGTTYQIGCVKKWSSKASLSCCFPRNQFCLWTGYPKNRWILILFIKMAILGVLPMKSHEKCPYFSSINPRLMDDEIHVEKPTGRDGIIVPFLMQFHGSLNDTWGIKKGRGKSYRMGPCRPPAEFYGLC